jgi:two-component system cell cycle response regulator DivK
MLTGVEAETGDEGVRLAQKRRPSLIQMDIRLPGINGIEAFGQLRADPTTLGIPVLAVTASVMPEHRQTVIDAGFDGLQSKSIPRWTPKTGHTWTPENRP